MSLEDSDDVVLEMDDRGSSPKIVKVTPSTNPVLASRPAQGRPAVTPPKPVSAPPKPVAAPSKPVSAPPKPTPAGQERIYAGKMLPPDEPTERVRTKSAGDAGLANAQLQAKKPTPDKDRPVLAEDLSADLPAKPKPPSASSTEAKPRKSPMPNVIRYLRDEAEAVRKRGDLDAAVKLRKLANELVVIAGELGYPTSTS